MNETELLDKVVKISKNNERLSLITNRWKDADTVIQPISPDGSTRKFYRIFAGTTSLGLAVTPGECTTPQLKEADALYHIGKHLMSHDIQIPEVFGRDKESGLVLLRDLGDEKLHDKVKFVKKNSGELAEKQLFELYTKVIDNLLRMQFSAIDGFDVSWCWDTTHYDKQLMITRESQYFESAFLKNLLQVEIPAGLADEFDEIADRAGSGKVQTFLHRDFQSRNIMLDAGEPYFIDFQGGRVGPPGYDLASLLTDPYASLSKELQDDLLQYYLTGLQEVEASDAQEFLTTFPYLKLQRQLQIVGAYSFLFAEKQKEFFQQFILPSFTDLTALIQEKSFSNFPILRDIVRRSMPILHDRIV